jgi:hypothetical protein
MHQVVKIQSKKLSLRFFRAHFVEPALCYFAFFFGASNSRAKVKNRMRARPVFAFFVLLALVASSAAFSRPGGRKDKTRDRARDKARGKANAESGGDECVLHTGHTRMMGNCDARRLAMPFC